MKETSEALGKKPLNKDILANEDMKTLLSEIKNTLEKFLGNNMMKIVLYGSRARGDYDTESDIDIAIIVRWLSRELKKQIFDVVADIEVKHLVSISTLVLSEENFAFLKKRERRIVADIEKEVIPL